MEINNITLYILFGVTGFIIGFFLGRIIHKKHGKVKDGIVLIESDDEEDKDIIRFIFNIELDDIKAKKELVFGVDNRTRHS